MKRYTEKKAAAMCEKVLKNARRNNAILKNGWYDNNKNFIVTDGYRAYKLKHFPNVDIITQQLTSRQTTDKKQLEKMEKAGEHIEKMLSDELSNIVYTLCAETLTNADIDKNTTTTARQTYCKLSSTFPSAYNPHYLKEIITLFPDASYYSDKTSRFSPLYAISENGIACLMPIRIFN